MKAAVIPENEIERLAALKRYEILDTMPERAYDDITMIASQICDTPIALVSLIDEARQWFKSRVGLGATETPRDLAFCAHAILGSEMFVVCDTLEDDRFADNPLVTSDPNIRFYAGTPLITPDGFALGTLCAIDSKPRVLNTEQLDALESLGRQVVTQLELTRSIQRMSALQDKTAEQADELRRSNAALHNFAHVVAHDLKAPLRSVNGMLGILQSRYASALDEKAIDYMQKSVNASERMRELIDGLLNYSTAGSMIDASVECSSKVALDKALENLQADITERKAELVVGDLPKVRADESRLMQIFQNLIANAIKFTPNDRAPVIRIEVANKSNEFEFTVVDNGMGVEPENLDKIFGLFARFHSRESIPGSGIGLATVRTIIESYKGKIWMTSEPGKGSAIHFVLPAA